MNFVPVIIVGGGVAGLAAAKTLANQVDFVLIEAQNYLGGRILTIDASKTSFSLRFNCLFFFVSFSSKFNDRFSNFSSILVVFRLEIFFRELNTFMAIRIILFMTFVKNWK